MNGFLNGEMVFHWIGMLQVSLQSIVLVGLILGCQTIFAKHLSAQWRYALWLLLVVQLLIPVSPPSTFSIYNLPRLATIHSDSDAEKLSNDSKPTAPDNQPVPLTVNRSEVRRMGSRNTVVLRVARNESAAMSDPVSTSPPTRIKALEMVFVIWLLGVCWFSFRL